MYSNNMGSLHNGKIQPILTMDNAIKSYQKFHFLGFFRSVGFRATIVMVTNSWLIFYGKTPTIF